MIMAIVLASGMFDRFFILWGSIDFAVCIVEC